MSGGNPPDRRPFDGFVTAEDVEKELNIIEELRATVSGQDEYLEAMLTNMRMQAMWMAQSSSQMPATGMGEFSVPTREDGTPEGYNVSVRPVPDRELTNKRRLPLDAVGLANENIQANDTGSATFQVEGTVFATTVRVNEDTPSGDPVRVIAPGNIVEPNRDVSLSLLGLGGSIGPGGFERVETPSSNVSIAPGETETVLSVPVRGADWVSVGTNDETHSLYQYYVDGDQLFETPLTEPLGLYNDPYQFPTPLSIGREVRVEVTRQSSASGSADYFSKITLLG